MRSNYLSPIDEQDEDGFSYYTNSSRRGGRKVLNAAWKIMGGSKRRRADLNQGNSSRTLPKLDTQSSLYSKRKWSQWAIHFLRRAVVLGPVVVLMFL